MSRSRNLIDCPAYKLADRRINAQRVLDALLADPDAQWDFKGPWKKPTPAEIGNWEARQHFLAVILSYPSVVVEAPHSETVDETPEPSLIADTNAG